MSPFDALIKNIDRTRRQTRKGYRELIEAARKITEFSRLIEVAARNSNKPEADTTVEEAYQAVNQINDALNATKQVQNILDDYKAHLGTNPSPDDEGVEDPEVNASGSPAVTLPKVSYGKGTHTAKVTVIRNGAVVAMGIEISGDMTREEAALGFPLSMYATHTEARAVENYSLQAGDEMVIDGQLPPCRPCKGKMNIAARANGARIRYVWPGGEWSAAQ